MVRALFLFSALALMACQMPVATQSGAHLYDRHCRKCHGPALMGDGPLAEQLPLAPPDLTGLSERNDGVFPMADVLAQIHGYPGRHHDGLMPEFAPELSSDLVTWTAPDGEPMPVPREILLLAQYLERNQR